MPKILLIYTGGTIGMLKNPKGHLSPIDFSNLTQFLPEIKGLNIELITKSFDTPIDSSNMRLDLLDHLVDMIEEEYQNVDGVVILHGSDTMAHTASALSFMLEGLQKPVILTGSQLPIGVLRTDGKENLITALQIASTQTTDNNGPLIREVCIYFEYKLYRGNRTYKYNAEHFNAYDSPNYPFLAEAGVQINFNKKALFYSEQSKLTVRKKLDNNIAVLPLFVGISDQMIASIAKIDHLKGLVLQSFGAGNLPNNPALTTLLKELSEKKVLLLNISQCQVGRVEMEKYATNPSAMDLDIISGADMTLECAVAKLMYLLSIQSLSFEQRKLYLKKSLRGELTESA